MKNEETTENSWQHDLMDHIDNDFEKQVLKVAIAEMNPEGILQSVKEIIREIVDDLD